MFEVYGGVGVDICYSIVLMEEIVWVGVMGLGFGLYFEIVVLYLLYYGSEVLKQYYLFKLVSVEMIGVIVMIEFGVGFDL